VSKHLGIILVDLDSDTPEAARAVVERLAQQTRHRLAIDGSAKVGGVGVGVLQGLTSADFGEIMKAVRCGD